MNYYYSPDGMAVLGPCPLDELRQGFENGSYPGTMRVCAVGTKAWQTLAALLQPPSVPAASSQSTAPRSNPVPYAVKVLTTKDRFFSGKFDPEKLEAALNAYAAEGWSVAGSESAEFPGLFGPRSEMITIMHRIEGRMKKYKILTQKDRFFSGKFDPDKLESAINSYVPEGWRVCAVTTASFPGFGSNREEMIVVLEKEV